MNPTTSNSHASWESLPPAHLPRPMHYPAGLAMGTTLIFWGLISSWMTLAVGLGLFAAALFRWINEIRHERKRL